MVGTVQGRWHIGPFTALPPCYSRGNIHRPCTLLTVVSNGGGALDRHLRGGLRWQRGFCADWYSPSGAFTCLLLWGVLWYVIIWRMPPLARYIWTCIYCPIRALPRIISWSRHLSKTFIQREVMTNRVLPTNTSIFVVGKVVADPTVDLTKRHLLGR